MLFGQQSCGKSALFSHVDKESFLSRSLHRVKAKSVLVKAFYKESEYVLAQKTTTKGDCAVELRQAIRNKDLLIKKLFGSNKQEALQQF